jgi:hypothetical protein
MFARLKAKIAGILIGVLLAGLLAVMAVAFIPSLSFPFSLPFTRHEVTTAHELILRELRPVFTLSTVEYSYKSVFPYDFLPEGVEPGAVMRKQLRGEPLDSAEREAADLLALCRSMGIDLSPSSYQFVVIESRVRGGFRLSGTPWTPASPGRTSGGSGEPSMATEEQDQHAGTAAESIVSIDREHGRVEVALPPPEITSFIIEDETSEEYRYPDIQVDPQEWRRITEYVRGRIKERVIAEGILEKSRENGRRLVRRLLQEAGWEEVVFTELSAEQLSEN